MGPLDVLRHRAFRIYWVGQAISLTGTWMQVMAQGWVLTDLSANPQALGLFNVVGSLPMLLLGARGGEIADRLPKRRILLVTQVVMMALALAFAGLVWAGALQLWHIFVMCFLVGIVEAFEFPASQGFAPELVGKEHISQAVGMMQAIFHGSRLVGPAIAGVLIAEWGTFSAFLANGLSFAAVIVSLLMLAPRKGEAPPVEKPAGGNFREGLSYVRRDAITRSLFILLSLAMTLVFPFMVLLAHYAKRVVMLDAVGMGNLMSGSGVGALLGAGVVIMARPESWPRRLWLAVLGVGLALVGMALSTSLAGALLSTAGLTFSTSLLMGTVSQTVQMRIPPELRGRISALFGMAFTSILPFSGMVVATVVATTGMPLLMMVCAGLYVLVGMGVLLTMKTEP